MELDPVPSRRLSWKNLSIGNLALYRKRLEEPHTDAEQAVFLKLLAEEEKKEAHPKKEE